MNRSFGPRASANGVPAKPDPITTYYDELNALWKQAEEHLAAMRVSVPVEVEVIAAKPGGHGDEPDWYDTVYLGWRKVTKDWRLCVGVLTDYLNGERESCDWKPIAESPMETRIELAPHFLKLKARMKEVQQKLIPQIAGASASLREALAD